MHELTLANSPFLPDPLFDAFSAIRIWFAGAAVWAANALQFAAHGSLTDAESRGTDDGCIQRTREGDRQAFEELVYRYQDMIFNLCVRLMGSHAEGEDAAQETFIKAFQGIQGFKGESLFSTWLFRIATNICRNRQTSFWGRLSRRAVRLDNPGDSEDGDGDGREIQFTGKNPEELLEQKRTAAAVKTALEKLPSKHRELIVLADINERSYEEIHAITGMALGTIKSRLARGREALRALLESK
jgi:RNA polymerase sigma-70 factor (ECF subfamily)